MAGVDLARRETSPSLLHSFTRPTHSTYPPTKVMLRVDRGNYCPDQPYNDSPQYLGFEQTISAPHMHAHALELLQEKLKPGATVSG